MKNTSFNENESNFIPNTLSSQHPQIEQESDRQMLTRVGIRFGILFFVLLMFDSLLDWLIALFDLLFELIHLVMDLVEYSIELILEYTIQTGHQESDIIMINAALIIALYLIYRFFFAIPKMYTKGTKKGKECWLRHNKNRSDRWHALSLSSKAKLISAYSFGTSCLLFLVTL